MRRAAREPSPPPLSFRLRIRAGELHPRAHVFSSLRAFYPLATFFLRLILLLRVACHAAAFFAGKKEAVHEVFGIVALAYVGNFVLFYAFPSLCPRMTPELEALRTADYSGYFIASLTQYFQSEGAISGGCFPSTIPLNKHWQFAATFCLFAHPSSLVIL